MWGLGDATGCASSTRRAGRVGALICWESYMPLARYALYAQGIDIYIAPTYDCGDRWLATMQHIAREGGCWVIGTATAFQGTRPARRCPARRPLVRDADEWINARRFGRRRAGRQDRRRARSCTRRHPVRGHRPGRAWPARRTLDVGGPLRAARHLFRSRVDRRPLKPVEMHDTAEPSVRD